MSLFLGYFILSLNHIEISKVAQLAKKHPIGQPDLNSYGHRFLISDNFGAKFHNI
jgi:hypothetical protein